MMLTPEDLREEERRMRRLRVIVDFAAFKLSALPLSEAEAETLIRTTRERVLNLFPDKGEMFDLIYLPRFRRLLEANPGVRVSRELERP
jgi:hypothetical protein